MVNTNTGASGSGPPVTTSLADLFQAMSLGGGGTITFLFHPGPGLPATSSMTVSTTAAAGGAGPAPVNAASPAVAAAAPASVAAAAPAPVAAAGPSPVAAAAPAASPALPAPIPAPVAMDPDAIAAGAAGANIGTFIDRRYYVVSIGCVPGVYSSWSEASVQVTGVPSCCFNMVEKGIEARNNAMRAFNAAWLAGTCTFA
ncbi:hypothetical protein H0H92_006020 [Tricholoma furcatifolium]|nr:hypothetical protein H0H92_006020 [Tricholoma furcatifolium]